MPEIPPWLKPPDEAGPYIAGIRAGQEAAETNARLQMEQRRMQMEGQARQEQIKRDALLEQTRLATQQAYHQTQLELERQRVGQQAQNIQFRTQQAAQKLADQQKFSGLIAKGIPVDQALTQVPGMATPQSVIAARRDNPNMAQQRMDLARQNVEMTKKRLELEAERLKHQQQATPSKMIMSLGELYQALRNADPSTPEGKKDADDINALIRQRISGVNTKPSAPSSAGSPFKEGQTIRDKRDPNKVYIIKNGKPVPYQPDGDNE